MFHQLSRTIARKKNTITKSSIQLNLSVRKSLIYTRIQQYLQKRKRSIFLLLILSSQRTSIFAQSAIPKKLWLNCSMMRRLKFIIKKMTLSKSQKYLFIFNSKAMSKINCILCHFLFLNLFKKAAELGTLLLLKSKQFSGQIFSRNTHVSCVISLNKHSWTLISLLIMKSLSKLMVSAIRLNHLCCFILRNS